MSLGRAKKCGQCGRPLSAAAASVCALCGKMKDKRRTLGSSQQCEQAGPLRTQQPVRGKVFARNQGFFRATAVAAARVASLVLTHRTCPPVVNVN